MGRNQNVHYMSEVSNSKISDLKPEKMIILWTLKHVSAISEHPVFQNTTKFTATFTTKFAHTTRNWRSGEPLFAIVLTKPYARKT